MKRLWEFLAKPQNLALLLALGAAVAFLWKEMIGPLAIKSSATQPAVQIAKPAEPAAAPIVSQNATANNGTAVTASGNAKVSFGAPAEPE